ncbi:hypothetical protein HYX19_02255 [Candidatus Woesearchaeota archaeon]|nr:hypothetical protein [Candidatus Woesearchaeota archaeon]
MSEYYILKKDGKIEYEGKEWCNLVAYVSARKSKKGYTLSSISIQNGRALVSHVYYLEIFLKPSVEPCSTVVDIPLKDLELLLKEAKEGIEVYNKESNSCGCWNSGYEGR